MDRMTQHARGGIVVGVDTHRDTHVAVALDAVGGRLGELDVPATSAGYVGMERWAIGLGPVRAFGIEGTGSYGAGLARHLRAAGHTVREVDRPDRSSRRRRGKSDPIDAELAARAVLAGTATTRPKHADGAVEAMRMVQLAKRSAHKARTAALLQLRSILVTAPAPLREGLSGLAGRSLVLRCAALRSVGPGSPAGAARLTLRLLARRILALETEIGTLDGHLAALVAAERPALLDVFGVGPDTAAALLVAVGDNPDRVRSEAALAALCGVNPIPASSGLTRRHRLNRGGDRQANAALYRIVLVRLVHHQPTRDYMARRTDGDRRSKRDVIRCLKRYVARQLFPLLVTPGPGVS